MLAFLCDDIPRPRPLKGEGFILLPIREVLAHRGTEGVVGQHNETDIMVTRKWAGSKY